LQRGNRGGLYLGNLPEFFLTDATFDHAELIEPFEVEERLRSLRESSSPEARALVTRAEQAAGGDILAWLRQAMSLERSEERTEMRLQARHQQAKAQVNNARNMIATNILALRSGSRRTIDTTAYGPIYKALDGHYIKVTGLKQKEMTVTDLQAKYEWLQAINDRVREGEIPGFLDL
jgi:hypothetical protein